MSVNFKVTFILGRQKLYFGHYPINFILGKKKRERDSTILPYRLGTQGPNLHV